MYYNNKKNKIKKLYLYSNTRPFILYLNCSVVFSKETNDFDTIQNYIYFNTIVSTINCTKSRM